MTLQDFLAKWGNGCGNDICTKARSIVLARGSIPARIAFIGEAPGISEDSNGVPFVGPAGKLLDSIIASVMENLGPVDPPTYILCNMLGCIPRDPETGDKTTDLQVEDVLRCGPRLVDFLELCAPELIITVGDVADEWLNQGYKPCVKLPPTLAKVRRVHIDHPGRIIRTVPAHQNLMIRQCIVTLHNAVLKLISTPLPKELV